MNLKKTYLKTPKYRKRIYNPITTLPIEVNQN